MPETFYYQGKLNFVWDEDKNKGNIKKHGISFETATLVFNDTYRIDYFDEENSADEDRYNVIGLVGNVIFVVYSERVIDGGDHIRIITARPAYGWEISAYNDNVMGRF